MEKTNRFPAHWLPVLFPVAGLAAAALLSSCSSPGYFSAGRTDRYVNASPSGGRPDVGRPRYTSSRTTPRSSSPDQHRIGLLDWLFGDHQLRESRNKKKQAPQRPAIPPTKTNDLLLARSNASNTRVVIDIAKQRAFLLVDGRVAMEAPVSTARPGKHTPRGSFRISEKIRSGKISTIYGVGMPYWMRLSGSVYGVHAGYLPGYPASAGCVRLPSDAAQIIFDHTRHGTQVSIHSSWAGEGGKI